MSPWWPWLSARRPEKQSVAKFDQTAYSFGTIPEKGGKVSHTFEFTNEGDANLVIVDASADCGCTVPEFSREPVKPGDEGEITVRFNGKGRPHGSFKKIVRVRSNALNSLAVAFVKGRIARPVRRK